MITSDLIDKIAPYLMAASDELEEAGDPDCEVLRQAAQPYEEPEWIPEDLVKPAQTGIFSALWKKAECGIPRTHGPTETRFGQEEAVHSVVETSAVSISTGKETTTRR